MIHLELILIYGVRQSKGFSEFSILRDILLLHLLGGKFFLPLNCTWASVIKLAMLKSISVLFSTNPFVYLMPISHCLEDCSLKSDDVSPPTLFFFKIILAILGHLHINLGSVCEFPDWLQNLNS